MPTDVPGFGPMPKIDRPDNLQDESFQALQIALPTRRFKLRKEDQDKGVDLSLEAKVDDGVVNMRSQVQLKGTDSTTINSDGSLSKDIKTSNLNYLLSGHCPLYIIWIAEKNELRYAWARDVAVQLHKTNPEWMKQASVTIRFQRILDASAWDEIHERILQEGRLNRDQHRHLATLSSDEPAAFAITPSTLEVFTSDQAYTLIRKEGIAAVSGGFAKDVVAKSKLLSSSQLLNTHVQLALAYATHMLGDYNTARGHLSKVALASESLNEFEQYIYRSILNTCELYLGRITQDEWQTEHARLESEAPEFIARQLRLDRLRRLHHYASDTKAKEEILPELLKACEAIESSLKITPSMLLSAKLARIQAEGGHAEINWIHTVADVTKRARAGENVDAAKVIDAADTRVNASHKSISDLLNDAITYQNATIIAEARLIKFTLHTIHRTSITMYEMSEIDKAPVIDSAERESVRSEAEGIIDLYNQLDDTEGAVRAMLTLCRWLDLIDSQDESKKVATNALRIAKAMNYSEQIPQVESFVKGETEFRAFLDLLKNKNGQETKWTEVDDGEGIEALARNYASETGIPKEQFPNVLKTMKSLRLAGLERANHCQHLYICDSQGVETYERDIQWVAFCRLIGNRTHVSVGDAVEAINKLKRVFCDICDKREPLPASGK
jgi:hypothetical protein